MKKIITYVVITVFLSSIISCEKKTICSDVPSTSGDFARLFSLCLSNGLSKSASAVSGETSITEATVFIYQTNGDTGEESFYSKVSTSSESAEVMLLFNGSTEYTYRFEAYANMGTLTEEPSLISFSNESPEGLQMHGSLSGINQDSASEATVILKRYTGRAVIESIRLNWKYPENASQDFILKRIWLANTAEVPEGSPVYNTDGYFSDSPMNAFLVCEVNSVIENHSTYSVPSYLYGYGTDVTEAVLECEWAGSTMYYHIGCDLMPNKSTNMSLIIRQTGSDVPLGSISDDALTKSGMLQTSEWNETEVTDAFGEEQYQGVTELPADTPLILRTNGRLYTSAEWNEMNIDDQEAVGVAVSDGINSLIIHPETICGQWTSLKEDIPLFEGISMIENEADAMLDFAGKENTDAVLAAVEAGLLPDAPAFRSARNTVFVNGAEGYIPASGELYMIGREWSKGIGSCMEAIGGDERLRFPRSSTLKTGRGVWIYNTEYGYLSSIGVNSIDCFYVVCEF